MFKIIIIYNYMNKIIDRELKRIENIKTSKKVKLKQTKY